MIKPRRSYATRSLPAVVLAESIARAVTAVMLMNSISTQGNICFDLDLSALSTYGSPQQCIHSLDNVICSANCQRRPLPARWYLSCSLSTERRRCCFEREVASSYHHLPTAPFYFHLLLSLFIWAWGSALSADANLATPFALSASYFQLLRAL